MPPSLTRSLSNLCPRNNRCVYSAAIFPHSNTVETHKEAHISVFFCVLPPKSAQIQQDGCMCRQGFGPFRQHLVNSSWEAAKELSKLGLGNDVDLHIIELPVAYQKAKEIVCKAWATLNPKLMIHLGLASTSKGTIILEQCGKNKGYKDMDVCRFCPQDNCCLLEGPERIESIINMKRVWKNLQVEGVDVIFSRDAGRYLCDYVYYTSLYYGNGRAAFIHVPPLTKLLTAEFLGNVLQTIILEMLTQCKAENILNAHGHAERFLRSTGAPP